MTVAKFSFPDIETRDSFFSFGKDENNQVVLPEWCGCNPVMFREIVSSVVYDDNDNLVSPPVLGDYLVDVIQKGELPSGLNAYLVNPENPKHIFISE